VDVVGLPYAEERITQEVNQLKVFSAFGSQQFGRARKGDSQRIK
jgi:hypothetical protein